MTFTRFVLAPVLVKDLKFLFIEDKAGNITHNISQLSKSVYLSIYQNIYSVPTFPWSPL